MADSKKQHMKGTPLYGEWRGDIVWLDVRKKVEPIVECMSHISKEDVIALWKPHVKPDADLYPLAGVLKGDVVGQHEDGPARFWIDMTAMKKDIKTGQNACGRDTLAVYSKRARMSPLAFNYHVNTKSIGFGPSKAPSYKVGVKMYVGSHLRALNAYYPKEKRGKQVLLWVALSV
jgi:hypothetical protein